eukprot:g2693.t1
MTRRIALCRIGHVLFSTTQTPPPDLSRAGTADLCDIHHQHPVDETTESDFRIVQPLFKHYGKLKSCLGKISTVRCYENNPLVRKVKPGVEISHSISDQALEEAGVGRVLVVDGGASSRCALLGDNLAQMAYENGWIGIIVNGYIRDSADINEMPLLVKALGTYPLKSSKRDPGLRDVPVSFAGVTFHPGEWLAADGDGIVVSKKPLFNQN